MAAGVLYHSHKCVHWSTELVTEPIGVLFRIHRARHHNESQNQQGADGPNVTVESGDSFYFMNLVQHAFNGASSSIKLSRISGCSLADLGSAVLGLWRDQVHKYSAVHCSYSPVARFRLNTFGRGNRRRAVRMVVLCRSFLEGRDW